MWRSTCLSAAVIALALGLGACGGTGSADPIAHPSGDALVLRVETTGGLIPNEARFTAIPGFSLFGDGRVITTGPVMEIYPGPAVAPVLVRTLSEAGIQAVLREVAATGLFTADREFKGAEQSIADAGTTVFTLHADGREVRITVYALGMLGTSGATNGISGDEIGAHRALTALSARLGSLDSWLTGSSWTDAESHAYRASALRLLVRNADGDAPDPSGIENQVLIWPGSAAPATFGSPVDAQQGSRCGVVSGADATAWQAALAGANQLTRFAANGHRYAVSVRPLLPDEPATCPVRV
ncbi:MAG: hypothetical protein M3P14_05685 [Chloroflexota bacterium]|nr:hypothetical protein [Chloroflexota bacterium]